MDGALIGTECLFRAVEKQAIMVADIAEAGQIGVLTWR
jgi:hypothetical protein